VTEYELHRTAAEHTGIVEKNNGRVHERLTSRGLSWFNSPIDHGTLHEYDFHQDSW